METKTSINHDSLHDATLKLPKEERRKARSKTFSGIAEGMSSQWGTFIRSRNVALAAKTDEYKRSF